MSDPTAKSTSTVGSNLLNSTNPHNAIITLADRSNSGTRDFYVNITSLQTGIFTQYDSSQVRRGISWFPIRRGEMFISFTIQWALQSVNNVTSFHDMQLFQNSIRSHHRASALTTGSQPTPMTLTLLNNANGNPLISDESVGSSTTLSSTDFPSVFQGWIQTAEKEYSRFKSTFTRSYNMNILNNLTGAITSSGIADQANEAFLLPVNVPSNSLFNDYSTQLIKSGIDVSLIPGESTLAIYGGTTYFNNTAPPVSTVPNPTQAQQIGS